MIESERPDIVVVDKKNEESKIVDISGEQEGGQENSEVAGFCD